MPDSLPSVGKSAATFDVRAVAHTHWDREWYHAAPRFRQRLVALVDALLERVGRRSAGQRSVEPFLLDGQAVVLEDYLAVRPERQADLSRLLAAGALEAGPWYVLADGLIPSGEALVRNLLAGRRVLRRLGASAPPVAYCPDTFGHPAALPLIAAGFGLPLAIVWRGYGGARSAPGDTFRWRSANGDEITVYHLPPDGYETGSSLPVDSERVMERWRALEPMLRARSNTGVVLLPSGADHHAAQPDFDHALRALSAAAAPDTITRDSLSGFASRLLAATGELGNSLPLVQGEMRDSYGYTWTLGGTLGTRAHQKRANAHAERVLLRDVEPWVVLAWLHGGARAAEIAADGRTTLAQAPALLDSAWRTLLRAHPHDTLCGCSIDAVARAMDGRLASVETQARGLRESMLQLALHHDPVEARTRPINSAGLLVVRNRSARWRGGVAEVVLDETLGDVAVGPASGLATAIATDVSHAPPAMHDAVVQYGRSRVVNRRRESPQHYPDNDLVRAHYALAWLPPVPPLGLAVHALTSERGEMGGAAQAGVAPHRAASTAVGPQHPVALAVLDDAIEISNGIVRVRVTGDGVSVTLGSRTATNALSFETAQDVGDSYTPAIRGAAEPLALVKFEPGARGPLRASARLHFTTKGPQRKVRVMATVSLDAESHVVRVDVLGINARKDHRLRLLFHSDVRQDESGAAVWADAAFGRVLREPLRIGIAEQRSEHVVPTMPMHRYVTLTAADSAATLHGDGLAEVEALENGTVALTLVRSIGELSRNDLVERPGHAGWPAPIPLAQSQGKFRARVGLQLHDPWSDVVQHDIELASESLLLPLAGETWRDLRAATGGVVAGPQLEGDSLEWSAAALADDGDGIVLRCLNNANEPRDGAWTLPFEHGWEVARARLDETLFEQWRACGARIHITVPARGVETVRVRRSR